MRNGAFALSLVLVLGLAACSETVYVVQEDAGIEQDDATVQEDAQDAAPPCGPDIYPCPPYGTVSENVIENLTFTGWTDDNQDGNPMNDPYREWGLDMFYQKALAQQARYLYLNVSAGWCTACRQETPVLKRFSNAYASAGIVFAQVLFEDNDGNPVTKQFLETWATSYALPFTVGIDPSFKMGQFFDAAATPANLIIDLSNMKIQAIDTGFDEAAVTGVLDILAQQ